MKTTFIILLITAFLLSSCAYNNSDTYFIHALSFDRKDNEYTIYALCEKADSDNHDYFIAETSAESIKKATEKLKNNYKECYFATAKTYLLSENADKKLIYNLAKEICSSNLYPSKSQMICIKGYSPKELMAHIKNENDLKTISKLIGKQNVNAVKFFSHYTSGFDISLPSLTINKDNNISKVKSTNFRSQE